MVQPNNDGALSYFIHEDFDVGPLTNAPIPATGALGISLISERAFPSGIIPNAPFFTVFEGVVVINGDATAGAAYSLTLDFRHVIPNQGEFTSHRTVITRIGSNQWDTVQLSGFNSVSFIPEGPWTDPRDDANTFEFSRHETEYMSVIGEMVLQVQAFQNDGVTQVARTPQLISLGGAGVSFYQPETQLRRGRDF